MHGLKRHALQSFLQATYGAPLSEEVARGVGLTTTGIDLFGRSDDDMAHALVDRAAKSLGQAQESLLEDFGTWLIASPAGEPLRRLLRFGGETFVDFLFSLEELPARISLALPDLYLPRFEVEVLEDEAWILRSHDLPRHLHVVVGILRAMADDYGTLAVLTPLSSSHGEALHIQIASNEHSLGRHFSLSVPA